MEATGASSSWRAVCRLLCEHRYPPRGDHEPAATLQPQPSQAMTSLGHMPRRDTRKTTGRIARRTASAALALVIVAAVAGALLAASHRRPPALAARPALRTPAPHLTKA